MNLPDSVTAAALQLKANEPWEGTLDERKAKFQAFVNKASESLIVEACSPLGMHGAPPTVVFDRVTIPAPHGASIPSRYIEETNQILIVGKASVTTLFWIFNLAAGSSRAVPLAHEMFEAFFPEESGKLQDVGGGVRIPEDAELDGGIEDGPGIAGL